MELCMDKSNAQDAQSAGALAGAGTFGVAQAVGLWRITCTDGQGNLKWIEETKNLIVTQGLDSLLGSTIGKWTQVNTWSVIVTSGHPTAAAGDTGASHAGWAEFTGYSETIRQPWLGGAVSGASVTNSNSKAVLSINAAGSIGGAGLLSVNSKGVAGGSLFAVGSFSLKTLSSGDTLQVQATFTTAAG